MRQPGIEPGSIACNATLLTFTPPTLLITLYFAAENFNFLWNDDEILYNTTTRYFWKLKFSIYKNIWVCQESNPDLFAWNGTIANLYTTDAVTKSLFYLRKF